MAVKDLDNSTQRNKGQGSTPLARWAGALLLAAALFGVTAIVLLGSLGRQNPAAWCFVVLGVLSLLGWFLGRRQQEHVAGDSFARQRTLLGVNALTSVLLLAILLVGLNYIAGRRHKILDLTSNKVNSLSAQTHQALNKLPGTVTMTYVYAPRSGAGRSASAVSLLDAYRNLSDKVRVQYLDATQEPARAAGLNLRSFSALGSAPVLLVELENKQATKQAVGERQEVSVVDEQNVTSALLKLIDPQPRVIYFLTGHGQLAPALTTPGAPLAQSRLSLAQAALESQNYTMKTISLSQAKAGVPPDAAALIVAGPQADLTVQEEKSLRSYVTGKGRLLLMMTPARAPLQRWKSLAQSLGISIQDGFVLDFQSAQPQVAMGALGDATRHPILRGVSADVALPAALPMRLSTPPAGLQVTSLLESSLQSISQVQDGKGQSQRGPFVLAAAGERNAEAGGARVVVVSNALFATDAYFPLLGNASFFQACVNWLVGNDALVSIPPKPPVTNTLTMSSSAQRLAILMSLFALPVLVLIAGTVVWWKRR